MRRFIPKSTYARNVLMLISGTTVAQAVPIAISPILTRLYKPEEFGHFAIYMAAAMIIGVLVTGRYEMAIFLPRQEKDALHITALAIVLSITTSITLLFIVLLFAHPIALFLGDVTLAPWLYLVPASTLLFGIYQSLNNWSNRKEHFKSMSISRSIQSGSAAFAQLGSGLVGSGAVGLVGGQITGQVLATGVLASLIWREDSGQIKAFSPMRCLALAKKFIGFPQLMIPGQLANIASGYMPIFLLSIFYGPAIAGFYSLSQRVIILPMGVIGGAIGDVFRSEAAALYKKNGNCYEILLKTLIQLGLISLFIVLPMIFFGPEIFSIVFGEDWRMAGEIASLLGVMIFFQGVTSPTSQTILLAGMQRFDLAWQLLRFILSILSLYIGYKYYNDYEVSLILFSISFSVLYIIHSMAQLYVAKGLVK